jgi:hypothetical protein
MEPSSFILEFHPHLSKERWASFLLAVGTAGATSEWLSSHRIKLTCVKRSQLQHVGYIIYKAGHSELYNVVGVTGVAENRASEYAQHV